MDVFGHDDEGVKPKSAFAPVPIERLKEEANVVLDNEQAATLPC
jgi:hypothetical protein